MNSSTSSRRFELRERTSQAHQALDSKVGEFHSTSDYKRYLSAIAGFRFAVEPLLSGTLPPAFGGWRPSRIAAELRADLADLGLPEPPPLAIGLAPRSTDELIGAFYVLEGSAFGARLLYQRAQDLGLTATHGARHLAAQSLSLDAWRGLLTIMDATEPFDAEVAAGAASATFAAAERAFLETAHV